MQIDREQAVKQLRALGYQPKEKVFFTFFFPKGHEQHSRDQGRKLSCSFPRIPWSKIQRFQDEGRGCYIVINGGGHKAAEIENCRAFFYEHDNLPIEAQIDLWRQLKLPEPTFQVNSGGRSVHSYWVLSEPIDPFTWRQIQTDLLNFADADRALKNPNRVMRLAGCWHTGTNVMSWLCNHGGNTYKAEAIAAIVRKPEPKEPAEEPRKVEKPTLLKAASPAKNISEFLHQQVYPQLRPEQVYNWPGHDWKQQTDKKWKGACPFHESQSGTSFFIEPKGNTWVWCCAGCGYTGGGPIEYLDRLNGGNGKPRGATFRDLVEKLAHTAGLQMPDDRPGVNPPTAPPDDDDGGDPDELCQLTRNYRKLEKVLGSRLKLNTRSKGFELDGEPLQIEDLELQLALNHNIQIRPRDHLPIIVRGLGVQKQYDPVALYLENVHRHHKDTTTLENLAERFMGRKEKIFNVMLKRWLISAVARALDPGCRVDTALILQSPNQGDFKSTFFEVLAGKEYFDNSGGKLSDKDELLKLHRAWITEWAEFETVFKRKDISALKAFMTCAVDYVRPPYGKSVEAHKRPSVLVGTTNEDDFLNDPTGNRRFWVIPIRQKIKLDLVRSQRDKVWGAAVEAYKQGVQWWLTPEEHALAERINQHFQSADPWEPSIQKFLDGLIEPVTTSPQILDDCLKLDLNKQTKREEMRVAKILRKLGWKRGKARMFQGTRQRVWIFESEKLESFENGQKGGSGGDDCPQSLSGKDFQQSPPTLKEVVTVDRGGDATNSHHLTPPKSEVVTEVVTAQTPILTIPSEESHHLYHLNQGKDFQTSDLPSLEIGDWVFTPDGKQQVQGLHEKGVQCGKSWEDSKVYPYKSVAIAQT